MSEPKFTIKSPVKKSAGGDAPRSVFVQKSFTSGKHKVDVPEDPWEQLLQKAVSNGDSVYPSQTEVQDDQPILSNMGDLGKAIIEPPLTPTELELLVSKNTILPALIETMEVNIDGTGHEIVPVNPDDVADDLLEEEDEDDLLLADKVSPGQTDFEKKPKKGKPGEEEEDEEDEDAFGGGNAFSRNLVAEAEKKSAIEAARQEAIDAAREPLDQFFNECFPGVSFLTTRRRMRRDQERVGYAYMEVLRNDAGDVVFCRRIDPKKMRMLRLDEPRPVAKQVQREGKDMEITIHVRDRRYIQRVGKTFVYFKDFGVDRDVDRNTGDWAEAGTLPAEVRGTELMFFKNQDDVTTPYGIPRWMSNVPSVIGSRKAEEFNLDYFDSGGVPPMMILVQGGQLAEDVEQQLQDHFIGTGPQRHQVAILEAYGAGDMDSSQSVKVTVERFGSEQQNDSMFETYIEKCDARTRRSFRLPSIFLGEAESFNFATAFASYTVAEAQVFGPERMEFDEMINLQLMPELPNGREFRYHSLPLAVRDVAQQLEAAKLLVDSVEPGSFVDTINNLVGTEFQPKSEQALQDEADRNAQSLMLETQANTPPAQEEEPGAPMQPGQDNPGQDGGKGNGAPNGATPARKMVMKDADRVIELAKEGTDLLNGGIGDAVSAARWLDHREKVAALDETTRKAYNALVTAETFEVLQNDPEGMVELTGCVSEVRAGRLN